jgi:hypothetical protein
MLVRRLLRRKAVITLAAILSFTAIPAAGIIATAGPALAAPGPFCNPGGNMFCIGTAGLTSGTPVTLAMKANARTLALSDKHFTCCNGHEVYQLQVVNAPTLCLGIHIGQTLPSITLRDCSGGASNGTNWAMEPLGAGAFNWEEPSSNGILLTSDNVLGHQLEAEEVGCGGGTNCAQKWTD